MPDRQSTIDQIGELLSRQQFATAVKQATGKDVDVYYASESKPRAIIVSETLTQLELEGTHLWALTYILIAIASDTLRRQIVEVWPDTLVRLPQAEKQVADALTYLQALLVSPLPMELKYDLEPKQAAFREITQRIAALHAYKNLHEDLHRLDLKLAFGQADPVAGATGPDFNDIAARCVATSTEAADFATLLGAGSGEEKNELGWISQLQAFAASLKAAAAGADSADRMRIVEEIRTFVRFQLKRLNGEVFKAAIALSFEALTADLPTDIVTQDAFKKLVKAVRNLKPIVLARALKHDLWQEAENDVTVLQNFFDIPGEEVAEVSRAWYALKKRVAFLAILDPDDAWTKQARHFADDVEDGLVGKKTLDEDMRTRFEAYRNLLRFSFLAVDNTMKQDCNSLRKIDGRLTAILKELAP